MHPLLRFLRNLTGLLKLSFQRPLPMSRPVESLESLYNFVPIADRLVTSGQPTENQLDLIARSGYEVVINLALPTSVNALPDERAIVEGLGLTYVPIPVEWENPTLADFEQFVAAMRSYPARSVFVHCAANMRVSAFMYLYRHLFEGMSEAEARIDLEKIWSPNERWRLLIREAIAHYSGKTV